MKKVMFLLALVATLFTGTAMAQQRILTTPIYDGLSTYSSGGFTPLVWNITTHRLERADTSSMRFFNSFYLWTRTGGYSVIYPGTGKTISYAGIGNNKSGKLSLSDTAGVNYLTLYDTLGKWRLNIYKPLDIRVRGTRAVIIDSTRIVTIDSSLIVGGAVSITGSAAITGSATITGTLTATTAINLGSTLFRTGTGSPESVVTAPVGSLFLRTDGSAITTLYVKTSGSGNTGWTAK